MQKKWWSNRGRIPAPEGQEITPFQIPVVGASSEAPEAPPPEALLEAVREEAFRSGYQQGLQEGSRRTREELEAGFRSLQGALKGVESLREEIYRRSERELLELAVAIAARILRQTLEVSPEAMLPLVREAIAKAVDQETLRIRLHPQDHAWLIRYQQDLMGGASGSRKITWIPDATIPPGGCLVETRLGDVDARLPQQLEAVFRELAALSQGPEGD